MRREELDLGADITRDEDIAAEVDMQERAAIYAEMQRGDVKALQRRIVGMLGRDAVTIPSRTTRLHMREEDR